MSNLNLKNFAKIKDSNFSINDITVFAGKPGTGKSFIMKFLYAETEAKSSVFNGNYKMHYALADSDSKQQTFEQATITLLTNGYIAHNEINRINEIKAHIDANDFIMAADIVTQQLTLDKDALDGMAVHFTKVLNKYAEKQKQALLHSDEEKFHFIFRNILKSIFGDTNQINESFSYESNNSKFYFDDNKITIEKINLVNDCIGSLFVETPLILEFENFLPEGRYNLPYHIASLLQELKKMDYSFTSDEADQFITDFQKATASIIKGKISKSQQGFAFEAQNNKTYNIINASSGIKSIGLLQYLVKNKALKKGSTLYWEEPEVHLHPTWQLKMVELFIELMNAGVKIVFSTHSPYMADYLNAISTKQSLRNRVSFNLLSETDGVVSNTILSEESWGVLQNELLGSLEDIMWQYL